MKYFSFNNWGTKSIELEFECDECGQKVKSGEIFVPYPDLSADNHSDSQVESEGYAICDCGKEFSISVFVGLYGGDGIVDDLPDGTDIIVTENPEDYDEDLYEAIINNTAFFETFDNELNNK
jgi:hypothetical protein